MTKKVVNFIKNFFSRFTFQVSRCQAFTLAEVLITLGIIGVVASLTIPVLKDKFEKQATIEGYKKAYSTLQNAVKMSEVENGTIDSWNFPTNHGDTTQGMQFFNTYLAPYLSITKSCGTGSGCWISSKKPNGDICGSVGLTSSSYFKYILIDGMTLSIYNYGYFNNPATLRGIGVFIDLNGAKKPNMLGKDVFSFVLVENAAGTYNPGVGDTAGRIKIGGFYPDGYGLNLRGGSYPYRGCGKDVTYDFAGAYCGMKIIQDGYQIKDDYPW